jgi:hypothetical protein
LKLTRSSFQDNSTAFEVIDLSPARRASTSLVSPLHRAAYLAFSKRKIDFDVDS